MFINFKSKGKILKRVIAYKEEISCVWCDFFSRNWLYEIFKIQLQCNFRNFTDPDPNYPKKSTIFPICSQEINWINVQLMYMPCYNHRYISRIKLIIIYINIFYHSSRYQFNLDQIWFSYPVITIKIKTFYWHYWTSYIRK